MEKLYARVATATWCSGNYAGLILKGSGFDAVIGFDHILNLNVLAFLCVIRDEVEWWQQNKRKIFSRAIPKYAFGAISVGSMFSWDILL